jgi:hypothetical protein
MLDFLCALVTVLAAAAFAQFGVTLKADDQKAQPEVHRTDQEQSRRMPTGPATTTGYVRLPAPPTPSVSPVGQKGR